MPAPRPAARVAARVARTLLAGGLAALAGAPARAAAQPAGARTPAVWDPAVRDAAGGVPAAVLRGPFAAVASLGALDPAVAAALRRHAGELSDAGGAFNGSDAGGGPHKRFVVAGVSTLGAAASASPSAPRYWVVCYERGGRGYGFLVAAFAVRDGVASVRRFGPWSPRAAERDSAHARHVPVRSVVTLARVLAALRDGELSEDGPSYW